MPQSMDQHRKQVKHYYTRRGPDQIFNYDQYTCSEHYSPYYGYLIADRLADIIEKHQSYQLFEVGGGRGQLAFDLLTRLKNKHPIIFKKTIYNIVDISHTLSKFQRNRLSDFPDVHFINASATHLPFLDASMEKSIILCNEVLADLPSSHGSKNERLPVEVKELVERAEINFTADSYFNVGAFEFLLEARRVLRSGALIVIEYGVENDPQARVLGGKELNHVEVAINKKSLFKAANTLFPETSIGPLSEFVGEENLNSMISKTPACLPDNLIQWLFNLAWTTENIKEKRIGSDINEEMFQEPESGGLAILECIKYWIEHVAESESANRYQKAFLENLIGLFAAFEQRFGHEATQQLFDSLKRLHQFNLEIQLESTLRAERGYLHEDSLKEDFFFLLCEL